MQKRIQLPFCLKDTQKPGIVAILLSFLKVFIMQLLLLLFFDTIFHLFCTELLCDTTNLNKYQI